MSDDDEPWVQRVPDGPRPGAADAHCAECALTESSATGPLAVGALVDGRYRIEGRLGEGGMGEVYRARDVHLGRTVAIKRPLRPRAIDPRAAALFEREAALLARMQTRNVAMVHAFGCTSGSPFFVMEFVQGPTLETLISRHASRHATLPLARSVSILRATASALEAAHALGILHRDVKPSNIIVEHDTGRVVLVDFGLAQDAISARPSDRVFGTVEFLAPELFQGERPSPASDQFALAVVAYELLTGVRPFATVAKEPLRPDRPLPPPPSRYAPAAGALDRAILRALASEPRARFPTVSSFANAIRDAATRAAPVPGGRGDPTGATELEEGSLRVLVVDDDPLFVTLAGRCVQVALAGVPVSISRASTGDVALEKCTRRIPQLLLLDYHLPGADGVELLARIRELPEGSSVRVIVVTAGADDEAVTRFAALGVRRFARKPLDFDQVVELIATVARSAGWIGSASSETTPQAL